MIDKTQLMDLRRRVSAYTPPVLSLYVDQYPHAAENVPHAVEARVKNTLDRLDGVPRELKKRVLTYFHGRPVHGRALVLFADRERLDTMELDVQFLNDESRDQVIAYWGEPYLTPLLVAVDEFAPYGVLVAENGTARVLEVSLGSVEVLLENPAVRKAELPEAFAVTQQPAPEVELLSPKEQGRRIQEVLEQRHLERVIVVGTVNAARDLMSWLPEAVRKRVVAVMPNLPRDHASPEEILAHVSPRIREIEREKERALLEVIRERGIWGLDACLHALQEGRLHTVAYPKALHQEAFYAPQSNYVTLSRDEARELEDGRVEKVDLAAKLPSLVADWGARLEFMGGEAERELIENMGGMAGLPRW